jgi:hypothetical protein
MLNLAQGGGMMVSWRFLYPFSTAGAYFIRRKHLWMSYGLFTLISSLLFFIEKWVFFFYQWYDFERQLTQNAEETSFQSWIFLQIIFLSVVGIFWLGLTILFILYSRSCYKQFLFSEGRQSVTIRFLVGQSLNLIVIEETIFSLIGIICSFIIGGCIGGVVFRRAFHDFSHFYNLPLAISSAQGSFLHWMWHLLIALFVGLGCFLGYRKWVTKIIAIAETSDFSANHS